MMDIETFRVIAGTALVIPATLRDSGGADIISYAGTETLTCRVWPGASLPTTFSPAVEWEEPTGGDILITIEDTQTAGVTPGRYRLLAKLVDGGRKVAAYKAIIVIESGPVD